jgi:hypothetical protein
MSDVYTKQTKYPISDSYKTVMSIIEPSDMQLLISQWFESFIDENRKRRTSEKCVKFFIFRQVILSKLMRYLDDSSDSAICNSLLDYIDMTFAKVFFDGSEDTCALSRRVDNEFYFCLLAFALDRIEFPSLVRDSFRESYYRNNRNKVDLKRRNYLATMLFASRHLVDQVAISAVKTSKYMPTLSEVERICKKSMLQLINYTSTENARSSKRLDAMRTGEAYRLYRGYEIDSSQNVIVDRKIRLQDANKSISFTTDKEVARLFANYRLNNSSDCESTTLADRITLAESMFDDKVFHLKKSARKKSIVSEYLVAEDDIIFYPMTTTITECEVFAIPDNAKLTRYSIVYSH